MQFSISARIMLGLVIGIAASTAYAGPVQLGKLVTEVEGGFSDFFGNEIHIVESAKRLFWSLATISLVWTMGFQIVRQDIGEAMMELLRFIVVTGTFYWLLINATEHAGGDGFVKRIVDSFYQMTNKDDSGNAFRAGGNDAVMRGLNIFLKVIEDTSSGDDGERILSGLIGVMILVALTLLGAQFLLALILAWLLGYGGIFLLGFGGARWTSQIAINYYKHVVALGIAILALNVIGSVSENVFGRVSPAFGVRTELTYGDLGTILAVSVLMLVLGLRVPQLLYTLVTGSSLGFFAGTAGMVGSAIATGGGAAIASASGRSRTSDGTGGMAPPTASVARSTSAVEAIERSAVSASGMADPFQVAGGSDPFGVPSGRAAPRTSGGGSVFGAASGPATAATTRSAAIVVGENPMLAEPAYATNGKNGSLETSSPEERAASPAESWADGAVGMRGAASSPSGAAMKADIASQRPDYLAEMSAITAARADSSTHELTSGQTDPAREHLHMHEDASTPMILSTGAAAPDIAHASPPAGDMRMNMSLAQVDNASSGPSSQNVPAVASLSSPDVTHAFVAIPDDGSTMVTTDSHGTRAADAQAAPKGDDHRMGEMTQAPTTMHENVLLQQQLPEGAALANQLTSTIAHGAIHSTPHHTDTQSPASVEIGGQHVRSAEHDAHLADNVTLPLPAAVTDAAGAIPVAADMQIPVPPGADSQRADGIRNESGLDATPWAGELGVEAIVQAASEIHETDTPAERLNGDMQASGVQNADTFAHIQVPLATVRQMADAEHEPGARVSHSFPDAEQSAPVLGENAAATISAHVGLQVASGEDKHDGEPTAASTLHQVEYPAHRSQAEDAPSNLALTDIPSSGVVRSPSATMDAAHVSSTGDASRGMDHKDRDTVEASFAGAERCCTARRIRPRTHRSVH